MCLPNIWSRLWIFAAVISSLLAQFPANARLGETRIQCTDRYGVPKQDPATKASEKYSPILAEAFMRTFDYNGWRIRIASLELDGPVVRMTYQKLAASGVNPRIQDYELEAILKSNTPQRMSWEVMTYDNPKSPNRGLAKIIEGVAGNMFGQQMWRRSDGAIAWLKMHLIIQLELPAAIAHEARIKQRDEQKARASVPEF